MIRKRLAARCVASIAGMFLVTLGLPAVVSAQSVVEYDPQRFPLTTVDDIEPAPVATPLTPEMLRELRERATIETAQRRQALARPERVEARKRSRTLHAGLGRADAVSLARRFFGGLLDRPLAGPLASGERPKAYVGPFTARVEDVGHEGQDGVVLANHPLRVPDESGDLKPVDVSLQSAADGGWTPKHVGDPFRIAPRSAEGVQFERDGLGVAVGGEDVAGVREGESVFFANTQTDTDAFVKPTVRGVEVFWQLRSADSPERLTLDVDLPGGAALSAPSDAGIRVVKDGETVGMISLPVANDADGTTVPVTAKVEGSTIVTSVAHRGADIAYPIVVDPEVTASFLHHYGYDAYSCSPYHWGRIETDNPTFKIETHCGTQANWGLGMYVTSAQWPTVFPSLIAGEQGLFEYLTRGLEKIIRAYSSQVIHGMGIANNDCMVHGIAANGGGWEGAWNYNCVGTGAIPWVATSPGSTGNKFIFGATVATTTPPGWDSNFNAHMRDVQITMWEDDLPHGPGGPGTEPQIMAPAVHPDPIVGVDAQLSALARDQSVGIASLTFYGPPQWNGGTGQKTVANPTCNRARCSQEFTGAVTVGQDMPRGIHMIRVEARDAAGNIKSTTPTPMTFGDYDEPDVTLTGALPLADGRVIEAGVYDLQISAVDFAEAIPGIGVERVRVELDDALVHEATPPSPGPGTTIQTSWSFDTATSAAGPHQVRVTTTDYYGNVDVQQIDVIVPEPTPQPSVNRSVSQSALLRIDGASAGDGLGSSVTALGDINGDVYTDLAIGAPRRSPLGRSNAGVTYVVFGREQPATIDLADLDADDGFVIQGAAAGDRSGTAVASVPDVNGDGVADLLIGAPRTASVGALPPPRGAVFVVYGDVQSGPVDLAALGNRGFRIDGPDTSAAPPLSAVPVKNFGAVLRGGSGSLLDLHSDVNGDGLGDIAIGASASSAPGRAGAGSVFVVFGKTGQAPVDASNLGNAGFRIDGESGDLAGYSATIAGDMTGDGLAEVTIGAPGRLAPGRTLSGAAYIVNGRENAQDIDLSATYPGILIEGNAGDLLGTDVAAAGDADYDGRQDVAVSGRDALVAFGGSQMDDIDAAAPADAGYRIELGATGPTAISPAGDTDGDGTQRHRNH